MKLREALAIVARPPVGSTYRLHLAVGFEPLHLATFLKAHIRNRLASADVNDARGVDTVHGLFGDLAGNLERITRDGSSSPLIVVLEWTDVEPRLGMREGYRRTPQDDADIVANAAARLAVLRRPLIESCTERRVVLALPASPLPPWMLSLPGQRSAMTLELDRQIASFAVDCAAAGVFVADTIGYAAYDYRVHLQSGFPYTLGYADALADRLASLLLPAAPAKGLITDLDNTLWAGVVGDDGAENVGWSLETHARPHGLYQQFLAGLASQGVLLGVASKNDLGPVTEALARSDLLLPPDTLYPIEANWGSKSESIRRIAKTWNVGLDSLVFIDDSAFELAEVRQALPEVECIGFPSADATGVLSLLETLRARFGRASASREDQLRAASIRAAAELRDVVGSEGSSETLLAGLDARVAISFARVPFDARAFELLNKTNQFNLNGRRWEESAFRAFLANHGAVLTVAEYEDRLGALGKIAVAVGELDDSCLRLRSWVLSCRAFSRRVEFSMLRALFEHLNATSIQLDWQKTPRNGPTAESLAVLVDELPDAGVITLERELFLHRCPALYSTIC